jgi:hypothetical protein
MKFPLLFPADAAIGAAPAQAAPAPAPNPPVTRLGDLTSAQPGGASDDSGGDPLKSLDSLFEPAASPPPQKPTVPADDKAQPPKPSDKTKPADDQKPTDDKKPEDTKVPEEDPDDDLEASLRGKKTDPKKPADDKKPDDKKDDEDPSAKYRTNPELRAAFRTTVEKNKSLTTELAELRGKVKELEAGGPKAEQVEALTKQLQEQTKRNDELEQSLRVTDYRKSNEYVEKYQKPINSVVDEVKQLMPMLKVIVPPTDEGGQPTRRAATFEDFVTLFHADPGDVDQKAVDMFGASASRVIGKLDQLKNLDRMAHEANQNSTKLAKEHHERTLAETTARREKGQIAFRSTIAELEEKHPDVFGAKVEDSKEKEILSKGLGLIDEIFQRGSKMEPEQQGRMNAFLRMRAGAYPLLMHRLKKVSAELSARDKTIAELRETDPKLRPDGKSGGASGGAPEKPKEGDIVEGIDDIPLRR